MSLKSSSEEARVTLEEPVVSLFCVFVGFVCSSTRQKRVLFCIALVRVRVIPFRVNFILKL